jgi:choline dehydrogenase-like flavoprotein
MMVAIKSSYDYVIVGAGVSGVVVASRLREGLPSTPILLIEAGKNESELDLSKYAKFISSVRGSRIDYSYDTVPQKHLDGKSKKAWAGRALSGGGAINVGAWMRGPAVDYDNWAKLANDESWNFDNLLPFFRKSETFRSSTVAVDPQLHGTDGPLEIQMMRDVRKGKSYPLCDSMRAAWEELDPSLSWNADTNNGCPLGMGDWASTFVRPERQNPHLVFPLPSVDILTDVQVHRVILQKEQGKQEPRAVGVELVGGKTIAARTSVIICAGVYNSPKLLLLSGIGGTTQLQKHRIPVQVDLPAVGKGFRDDLTIRQVWRLRHPERGLSLGSPLLTDPDLTEHVPIDFFVWTQAPVDIIREALKKDGLSDVQVEKHALLHPLVVHQEMYTMWMAGRSAALLAQLGLSNDGSLVCTSTYVMSPTSEGTITLASADPLVPPVIDPNYYATETDKAIYRNALRKHMSVLLSTRSGKSMIAAEVPPGGFPALGPTSSDADLDRRIGAFAETGSHPTGSCAMGQVVDSHLRVRGVSGLRIIDASIFPAPIATHIQAAVYAVAEKGASLVLEDAKATVH